MDLRYVYRGIEDAIGAPFNANGHPHSMMVPWLRRAYRERRDLAVSRRCSALCLAAAAGNPSVDAVATYDTVTETLHGMFKLMFPYINHKPRSRKENEAAMAFKLLAEMKRKREEEARKKAEGQEKHDSGDDASGQ